MSAAVDSSPFDSSPRGGGRPVWRYTAFLGILIAAVAVAWLATRGRSEADNVVEIRAETYGRVTRTPAEKGTIVQVGDKLVGGVDCSP